MKTIDIKDMTVLDAGSLPDGQDYHLVLLKPEHAHIAAKMHNKIIDGLSRLQKEFMLPKSEAFFERHLDDSNDSAVMGVIVEGELVAQAVIHHPAGSWIKTGMVDMEPVGEAQETSVMQAVSVNPNFRGMGLMNILVHAWPDYAEEQGRTELLAEIDIRNIASWSAFLKGGMNLHSIGVDPADGTVVYNAHEGVHKAKEKRLSPLFNSASRPQVRAIAREHLQTQQDLFDDGFQVIGFNKSQNILIFTKDKDDAPEQTAGWSWPLFMRPF